MKENIDRAELAEKKVIETKKVVEEKESKKTSVFKSTSISKKRKIAKSVLSVLSIILVAFIALDWIASVVIYNANFNQRFTSYEPTMFRVEDFEGLSRTRHEFKSDKGQTLVGYLYEAGSENKKEIIIMAHGFGGGGHNSYMDVANYFAQHGYLVFAYDATGCDESEGEGVGGLAQGVADLDYAISYVEGSSQIPDLPIGLFGHSWGGYAVSSVLTYHPEVKAVIECSGFNSSSDMFEDTGFQEAGYGIYAMLPFVKLHERLKFGDYSTNCAMDGFAATDADVMVVHSKDDTVVPVKYGYDKYNEEYKDDSRFTFVEFDDRGHNYIFNDKASIDEINKDFDEWLKTLDYDYNSEENKEQFIKDKADFYNEYLDREKWADMLDDDIMEMFLEFYDNNVADINSK